MPLSLVQRFGRAFTKPNRQCDKVDREIVVLPEQLQRDFIGALNMMTGLVKILRKEYLLLLLLTFSVSGCTTANLAGSSAFGGNRLEVADISKKGSYTAAGALTEARGHFRNNNFGYSAAFYKRVVELSPKDPQGYVGLGASYDMLGRFELADRVYKAMYKLTGATAQYYNNIGYSLMLRGDLNGAYKNFKKAQDLAPDSIVIANNLQLLADAASSINA
ncbi:MAG: tetratricopeptide (TPR) repeat protein [Maritalea sp.]|jgi:tetratricopeptide (TPR) repeat protein